MSYNREDYIRIKAEFSQKYLRAQNRATERRAELYAAIPEVRKLDGMLSQTGMEIMAVIRGGKDTEEQIAAIRQRNRELLAKRAELLREHGYPEDYSDVQYDCDKCGDTGFVNTKMCDCMKRALIAAGYESSGLGALIRTQSFDNFSLDYYRVGGANYDAMRRAAEGLRRFAESFDRTAYANYLLIGGTGLGKTHLSTAVAKTVIERGFDVLYVSAVGMISDFEAKRFNDGNGMKHDPDRYADAELLIIDDLGTEVSNQFTLSCLYDLLNTRINNRRCTFINTNLAFRELEARYNERITSRLLGEYSPILFSGTDIRRQKIQRVK
ncbi:MAG: ATP-binding protein [Clostridia bacterium]|nr:ATP-binding protein [Clostridia bacterium]